MKVIETKKYAQIVNQTSPQRTPMVQDEGLTPNVQTPGATSQPAARPGVKAPVGLESGANPPGQLPQGSPNGPQVEPSDPDAEFEALENQIFPGRAGEGGNARPDVYPAAGTPAATPSTAPAQNPQPTPTRMPGMVAPFKRTLV